MAGHKFISYVLEKQGEERPDDLRKSLLFFHHHQFIASRKFMARFPGFATLLNIYKISQGNNPVLKSKANLKIDLSLLELLFFLWMDSLSYNVY